MIAVQMVAKIAEIIKASGNNEVYTSFSKMLALVAAAHAPSAVAKCVLIYSDGENLITMSANADALEAAEMCSQLKEIVTAEIMANAPPKEMFN